MSLPAQPTGAVVANGEGVVANRAAAMLQPRQGSGTRRLRQVKLVGPSSLLLHDRSLGSHPAARGKIANLDLNHVTTSRLGIDGKVEECSVAHPPLSLEPEPDRPNLLRLEEEVLGTRTANRLSHHALLIRPHSARGFWIAATQATEGEQLVC